MTCETCGATFTRFVWPIAASINVGDDSVTARPPVPRSTCPACGEPIAGDVDIRID